MTVITSDHAPSEAVDLVVSLLKSLETGDTSQAEVINDTKYIQHNLTVPNGKDGFLGLQQYASSNGARFDIVRAFQDGAYVFTHATHNFGEPGVGIDIFRFENGRIVEHWDNLQPSPAEPNPSGHTMVDGPTVADAASDTAANKDLVRRFVDTVLVGGDNAAIDQFVDGDDYIQHNPGIGDGVDALGAAFAAAADRGEAIAYTSTELVLGQGDFVLACSLGTIGDRSTAFYDLFRVAGGAIVEHWDVVQPIQAENERANDNAKF